MQRILVVDDHPLVSEAIGAAISTVGDFSVVTAASAAEMRPLLDAAMRDNTPFRIVFLDINLPDATGTDLIENLVATYAVPVIVVSAQDDEFSRSTCARCGASGFVKKSAKLAEFASALQAVLAGGQYFPALLAGGNKLAPQGMIAELSGRQRQVFDLIVRGRSNKQISGELFLAEGTVKNKVSELLKIFGVESRAQILFTAAQIGYKPHR